jgi:ATP-binding cassette subfamily B protein
MIKILKHLKKSWLSVILIFVLLIIQAYCDLSLPQYVSDIVDVGIQQSSIKNAVPKEIRASEMDRLFLFMAEDEKAYVSQCYTLNNDKYEINTIDKDTNEKLNDIFTLPTVMTYAFENPDKFPSNDSSKHEMQELPEGMTQFDVMMQMEPEQKAQMISGMREQFSGLTESILNQMAVAYIKGEYEALGLDINSMQFNYLKKEGLMMILLAVVLTTASIIVGFLAARAAALFGMDIRELIFKKVISFTNSEMDKFSTASLITRSTNDIQQIQMVIVMLLRMVLYAPILGIGGVIKVANTRTGMSWIIGVAVGVVLMVVAIVMNIAMPKFKQLQSLVDRLNLVAREILTGLPVIRAFNREEYEEKRFEDANKQLLKTQLFTSRTVALMFPSMIFIMNAVVVLIIWAGAHGIDSGKLQVGDMMAFMTYTMQIIMSFLMLTMISIFLPRAAVSANRINEVLASEPLITDSEKAEKLENVKGTVCFDNVNFRYDGADEDVLHNISFTARPGQTTAIIGSTGSGKSTLINLIPRFFDVTEGSITIDGIDIRNVTQHSLREQIGYVPQKGVLFSGTIASNLRFGRESASDEEIAEAASIAQADDFINEKTEKYESAISQGGSNVSGGQKQRLSIARAIAKNPKIYIFDDSFSALDYKTDIKLRKALYEKVADSTVIIVAQRISTVLNADQIIVLDDGSIAGIGTHKELLRSCEVYQQIAKSQLSEEELARDIDSGKEAE